MIAIAFPQFYGVHGIARYVDSFLANLPAGHPPVYLVTGDDYQTPRSYPGVEIIHLPLRSGRFSLFTWAWQARKVLTQLHREGKIQWVNFHFPPLIPGLFLPPHIPMVLTAHTTYLGMSGGFYPVRHFDSQWKGLSLTIKKWMEQRIFAHSAKVITLTEQGRQEVQAYGYRGPITVIPNGADTRKFQPDDSVAKDIDVLFSGRIERRKGSVPMVRLCRELVAAKPDIRICIVGYGEDDAWVQSELAPLAANVTLTGKVPFEQMVNYYRRSHVYAATSYYEGLPGTCLEAMAMQLPAVVWDFLFYRGLVTEGVTGALAAPDDFAAMRDKIVALLADPARAAELGRNGRRLLETDYSWTVLARQVLAVFDGARA